LKNEQNVQRLLHLKQQSSMQRVKKVKFFSPPHISLYPVKGQ